MLLTAAVGVGISTVEAAYEIEKISNSLDWINLMTYDFHGSWENFLEHNAPLKGRPEENAKNKMLNVKFAVEYWLSHGVPKQKLIMGMATYGRSFLLAKSMRNSPGSVAVGPGDHGRFSAESGFLTYYEICQKVKNEADWQLRYDDIQETSYAWNAKQWVSSQQFEDNKTLFS